MHALVALGVAGAYGVELDRIKCDKAAAFIRQTDAALTTRGAITCVLPLPAVQHAAVEQVRVVYIYSYLRLVFRP